MSDQQQPAPAGWPSDEAVARAIYTEGDDFSDDDWALCKRRDAKGVDRAREYAAAVQRLYAPLRERLVDALGAVGDAHHGVERSLKAVWDIVDPEGDARRE